MKILAAIVTLALAVSAVPAGAGAAADGSRIAVVAAENFYGDVARQIGGDRVAVASILSNPDQDPHLFEVSPAIVRETAAALVVIYNGADYDPWMAKLIAVTRKPGRVVILAADLMHTKAGANPHLWYDPQTMPAVAKALASALAGIDPDHADDYATRLKTFLASLAPIDDKIAAIRSRYAGAPVTATEPVYGYMAGALGLAMRNRRFQLAVMNATEPSARDVAAFQRDLTRRKVRVLFYNKQAADNVVRRLLALAAAAHIPVVGVTETCPAGLTYQQWMLGELDATERALAASSAHLSLTP